ncbi:DUF3443 domain-containing protein [Burkholderia territorii]|uniref:DUF3443 domain-containing protein n=1 Tax=Burkholderia territorii TaxID=1503055 RepID=UPI0009BCE584|nr:DUF3443 domain-containing protein [Burkholderia territorii]
MLSKHLLPRGFGILALVAVLLFVTGCGGGDDSGAALASNGAAGGGSQSPPAGEPITVSSPAINANSIPITVSHGAAGLPNAPNVSVTVCVPGTSQCQTISNILLDTGSTGLRVIHSAAFAVLDALPTTKTQSGAVVAECGQFVSGYTWGSVRTADVQIGSLKASGIPIHIVGDQGTTNVPTACSSGGPSINTVADLRANGILGVGPAPYDCGATCVTSTTKSSYFACPNGNASCQITTRALTEQVTNPVAHFASDNDGVIIQLNAPNGGVASGTLSFGVGTPPSGKTVLTTTTWGNVQGTFAGQTLKYAYMDTGSNGYFFDNQGLSEMPVCDDYSFYCPTTAQSLSASLIGAAGEHASVPFSIDNADMLFNRGGYAFANLGGPAAAKTLALGLPFFYGRTVYVGIDRRDLGGTTPPYIAF